MRVSLPAAVVSLQADGHCDSVRFLGFSYTKLQPAVALCAGEFAPQDARTADGFEVCPFPQARESGHLSVQPMKKVEHSGISCSRFLI